jgi:hypothetical protein
VGIFYDRVPKLFTMTVPAPLYPDSPNTVGSAFGAICPTSGAISICADVA